MNTRALLLPSLSLVARGAAHLAAPHGKSYYYRPALLMPFPANLKLFGRLFFQDLRRTYFPRYNRYCNARFLRRVGWYRRKACKQAVAQVRAGRGLR